MKSRNQIMSLAIEEPSQEATLGGRWFLIFRLNSFDSVYDVDILIPIKVVRNIWFTRVYEIGVHSLC